MRAFFCFLLIVLIALTSCRKEIDDGTFYITDQSKSFLPTTDSCEFISSDSASASFTKTEDRTYIERYISDTDGKLFTKYYYYQYFENIAITYLSENLTIIYHLYIDQLGDGPREFLNIQIKGPSGDINALLTTEYYSGKYSFEPWSNSIYEIDLNGIIYQIIYKYTDGSNDFYFQENKGLIGFTYYGTLWSLVD